MNHARASRLRGGRAAGAAAALLLSACSGENPGFMGDGSGSHDASVVRYDEGAFPATAPFDPSHVATDWFGRGTINLTINNSIDTSGFLIDGQPAPVGAAFGDDGQGLAVLSVRSLVVPAPANVRAAGTRPLVIIASAFITIDGGIDGGAHLTEPGPGGSSAGDGAGTGHTGSGSPLDSGGSGAGYHDAGGSAGGVGGNFCGHKATPRNDGGPAWGDPMIAQFIGGSGGGGGSLGGKGCPAGTDCLGGAGGGAIQLTAATAITVRGKINVGGGGGKGGCQNPRQNDSGSGGGGGSGGSLLLESLSLDCTGGVLAANGGGGGGGGFDSTGGHGADGSASMEPAEGGKGGEQKGFGQPQEIIMQRGGAGGTLGPGGSSSDAGNCGNSGGGGGAAGRIYLRSRAPAAMTSTIVSPGPASGIIP